MNLVNLSEKLIIHLTKQRKLITRTCLRSDSYKFQIMQIRENYCLSIPDYDWLQREFKNCKIHQNPITALL